MDWSRRESWVGTHGYEFARIEKFDGGYYWRVGDLPFPIGRGVALSLDEAKDYVRIYIAERAI